MSSGGIKLSKTEAARLAAHLEAIGRPRGELQEREQLYWVKRLEGGRS